MKFETVKDLDDEKFRRLTGVKRPTFDKMVGILNDSIKNRKVNSVRKKRDGNWSAKCQYRQVKTAGFSFEGSQSDLCKGYAIESIE